MSEQTTTTATTDDMFAGFGATSVKTVDNRHVDIPDNVRKAFANAVTHFSHLPNTHKLELNFSTADEADTFRKQVQTYADQHNLSAGLPKWIGEHTTERVDKSTGKVTSKVVPDNKVPKHYNVGTNVTFRFSPHKDASKANGPVTITPASMASK